MTCVIREFDASRINEIVNHPQVRPWLTEAGVNSEIDLSRLIANQDNVLLMIDGGGILFHWQEPGVYEAHTQFLPSVRGRSALAATRDSIRWMFTRTDCMEILSKVPVHNKGAEVWAQLSGASLDFERQDAWISWDGPVAVRYFALRYHDWVKRSVPLVERGRWFHEKLEAEKSRLGIQTPRHSDDSAHDRAVGSAIEMILGGQIAKGIILYNRWARFSGYQPIGLVSEDPVIIDIRDCLVRVLDRDFEVLPCQ